MATHDGKSTEEAFEKFKKLYFKQTGKEMSDREAEDVRFAAQMFAEIAYNSWVTQRKKFLDSKKTVPKDP